MSTSDTTSVEAIYITAAAGTPMQSVQRVHATSGTGLDGDRYAAGEGAFSRKPDPGRQVTLIEAEAVEAVNRDTDVSLDAAETRRNIVTRGVALNHLVDREFTVGSVRMRGLRLCEPCGYLEKLTRDGVRTALIHRGGLRAEVLSDGAIGVGDSIVG